MTTHIQRTRLRGWRRALAACFALSLLMPLVTLQPEGGSAVGINVIYDDTIEDAVDPCELDNSPACPDGEPLNDDLEFMTQVAAAYWSTIFHDMHNMEVRVGWVTGESPFARIEQVDGQGRPLVVDLLITADFNWYWDESPFDDDEFDMFPKLYRDTHPAEQAEAFNGDVPEIFEVGYNGVGPTSDLLSVILHELGHAIGLADDIIDNRPFHPAPRTSPAAIPTSTSIQAWSAARTCRSKPSSRPRICQLVSRRARKIGHWPASTTSLSSTTAPTLPSAESRNVTTTPPARRTRV